MPPVGRSPRTCVASGDDEGASRVLFVAVASCRGTATVRGGSHLAAASTTWVLRMWGWCRRLVGTDDAPVVHRRPVVGAPRIRRPGPDVPVEVARAGRRRVIRLTESATSSRISPSRRAGVVSAGHEAPPGGRPALHGHQDWLGSRPETLSTENGNTEARRTRITHGAARRGPGGSGRRRRTNDPVSLRPAGFSLAR